MKILDVKVGKKNLAIIANEPENEFCIDVNPDNVAELIELDEEGFEKEDEWGNSVPVAYDAVRFTAGRGANAESVLLEVEKCHTVMFTDEKGELITYEYDDRDWVAEQVVFTLGKTLESTTKPKAENVEKTGTPIIIGGPVMKTLAIRQPWATLIALGIKDVENRRAMPAKCQKILVTASMTLEPWASLSDEVQHIIRKCQVAGLMPAYNELPRKCIVGYVDIVETTFGHVDSPWAAEDGIKYVLRNAHELDEPIYGTCKATPYFYNVEGYDEEHLPEAHVADLSLLED